MAVTIFFHDSFWFYVSDYSCTTIRAILKQLINSITNILIALRCNTLFNYDYINCSTLCMLLSTIYVMYAYVKQLTNLITHSIFFLLPSKCAPLPFFLILVVLLCRLLFYIYHIRCEILFMLVTLCCHLSQLTIIPLLCFILLNRRVRVR